MADVQDLPDFRRRILEGEEVSDEELYEALEALALWRGGKEKKSQKSRKARSERLDPQKLIMGGKDG